MFEYICQYSLLICHLIQELTVNVIYSGCDEGFTSSGSVETIRLSGLQANRINNHRKLRTGSVQLTKATDDVSVITKNNIC